MNRLINLAAFFSLALLCLTVQPQSASAPTIPNTALSTQTEPPIAKSELSIAKAELELTRKFQDNLFSTVYWSLGTLAAIAALLVGYSWWNNSRNYDRDKTSFEREVKSLLTEATTRTAEEQRTSIQSRLDALETKSAERARDSETKLSDRLKAASEESNKQTSAQLAALKATVVGLRKEINKFHLERQLQERSKSLSNGSFRNALQDSVTALEMAIKIGDEYEIGNVLDAVSEDITSILSGKDLPIDNFLIGQLIEALDSVKGSHAHAAAVMKTKAPSMLIK